MKENESGSGAGRSSPPISPARIMELATGYWSSLVVLTLNEIDVFTTLGPSAMSAKEIAEALGQDLRALVFLLDAGVHLGLLCRNGQRYSNSPQAGAFLVAGRPAYIGAGLKYALDNVPTWAKLPEAIRSGEPQVPASSYLGKGEVRTRRFVQAMHHRAKGTAQSLAELIDLEGSEHLLDLGGGSGIYSTLLCRRYPGLRATLFDLPGVVDVAAEIVQAEGFEDRIRMSAGDYHKDPLGRGYDAVLISGVLHRESEDSCVDLLDRVYEALDPGGQVLVGDVMLDETGHGPLFPTLFALNMLLTAPGGGAHSIPSHVAWIEEVGFSEIRVRPLPPPSLHTLITARRA